VKIQKRQKQEGTENIISQTKDYYPKVLSQGWTQVDLTFQIISQVKTLELDYWQQSG
jgi:hypothetical protein